MPLDLSKKKSAKAAAKALYRYLKNKHDANAQLHSPSENPRGNNAWGVVWESGPYEWAIALTGGESMYAGEFGFGSDPEVVGFYDQDGWMAEPHFSFDLQFYDT